jgi:hypothetical protein
MGWDGLPWHEIAFFFLVSLDFFSFLSVVQIPDQTEVSNGLDFQGCLGR